MRIFTRYVLAEVLKYFVAGLAALTLLVTVGMAVREGLSKGLPPAVIATIMPYMLPEMLGITIPVTMLFAVTCVFGRLAGTNELVALKSAGVSPLRVLAPVLVLAATVSLATVWMYELAAVWSRPNVRRIVLQSVEEIAYGVLRTNGSFDCGQFSITVKRVEGRKLVRPTISIPERGSTPAMTLRAAEAALRTDLDAGVLWITCTRAEASVAGRVRYTADVIDQPIPLGKPPRHVHRDWLGMGQIPGHVARLRQTSQGLSDELAQQRLLGEEDESLRQHLAAVQRQVRRLRAEPYRRWSNGLSCLCFVLIGAPVAVLWRTADAVSTFFACFLPVLVVYYPLLMLGEDLSCSGALPPWAFCLPNVAAMVPGAVLVRRVMRY
jgi:lipopolysaccharide export system permease protein